MYPDDLEIEETLPELRKEDYYEDDDLYLEGRLFPWIDDLTDEIF